MTQAFVHGYAVVIGVDDNNIETLALPTVTKDVMAVHAVLVHPERCAYMTDNVRLVKGNASTRANIFGALDWLQEKVRADPQATAVVYYSGHGGESEGQYYLFPCDLSYGSIYTDAIKAEEFSSRIAAIKAKRMLVVLDCCHAAGIGVKEIGLGKEFSINAAAFPIDFMARVIPELTDDKGVSSEPESVDNLLKGEGRAVLNSSTGTQSSYLRKDRKMSLFTYHLIEALTGHAPHNDTDTVILVTDVMSWVTRKVEESAMGAGRSQTPVMWTSGVFPVALLLAGKGLSIGQGEKAPDPLAPLPEVISNQQGQTVGTQINASRNDQIGQIGDVTHGDTISVGDVGRLSNVAIGHGASVTIITHQEHNPIDPTPIFTPLFDIVRKHNPALQGTVNVLKQLVTADAAAKDKQIAAAIQDIADSIPAAKPVLVTLFQDPSMIVAVGPRTEFVLERLCQ